MFLHIYIEEFKGFRNINYLNMYKKIEIRQIYSMNFKKAFDKL